jgi:hypothetical protein
VVPRGVPIRPVAEAAGPAASWNIASNAVEPIVGTLSFTHFRRNRWRASKIAIGSTLCLLEGWGYSRQPATATIPVRGSRPAHWLPQGSETLWLRRAALSTDRSSTPRCYRGRRCGTTPSLSLTSGGGKGAVAERVQQAAEPLDSKKFMPRRSSRCTVTQSGVHAPQQIIVFDLKTWGWITLLWGILVALVGVGLLSASSWARWTAIVVASLSFIVQLSFIGSTPYVLWGLSVLALTVVVLYALIVCWDEATIGPL